MTLAYIYRNGNYWYVAPAFKPYNNSVTSATAYGYLAYKGKTVRDAASYYHLNKFNMRANSDGIWSIYGTFQTIRFNVQNTSGKIVADAVAKNPARI